MFNAVKNMAVIINEFDFAYPVFVISPSNLEQFW